MVIRERMPGISLSTGLVVDSARVQDRYGHLEPWEIYVGAVFVLPVGAWIGRLLMGHLAVMPLSYLTVQPRQGFCEVVLEKEDSQMLRAIGLSVRNSEKQYCEMLNRAFRVADETELVMTRFVTAKVTMGGKGQGKQRKTTHLEPNCPNAELPLLGSM